MDDHERNPAGRLWLFLSHMSTNGSPEQAAITQVASYVGAEQRTPEFYQALGLLAEQPPLMKDAVEALVGEPIEDLLSDHDRVVAVVDEISNPNVNLEGVRRQYDAGTLASLKFASHALNRGAVATGGPSSAEAIRAAAEELRKLVVDDTTLDDRVRRMLFELVGAMLRALDLLKVAGEAVVLDEFDRFYGRYRRVPVLRQVINQHPGIVRGLQKLLVAVNTITGLINAGNTIGGAVDDLLALDGPAMTIAPAEAADESATA